MGSAEFDRHQTETLGRIIGIVETLPQRFDQLDKSFRGLDDKYDRHQKDDNKRFSALERKANIVTGTVTALTAVAAGLAALFWGHKA